MNTIEPDSSHEAAAGESADRQQAHDIETDQQAARSDKAASGRQATQDAEVERAREVGALEERLVAIGGGGRGRRLLLIAIDGASPELAIGAWRTDLRTFHMLTDRGAWGRLYGSPPWSSTAAWFALLSGQDSGQLGIYGPRRRVGHSYAAPAPYDSRAVGEMRLWDLLGRAGKHIGVVGAPLTTPAPPIHGHMIGDRFLEDNLAIYPPSLRQQVALWLEDSPQLQPAGAGDPIEQLIGDAYTRSDQRFRLARRLLARDTYDCFMVFDDGLAAVQRAIWDSLDTTHARYVADHRYAGAINSFYRFLDDQIADLIALLDTDTIVAVVSACGAQALDGELALNDWLIAEGELTLRAIPQGPALLEDCDVDWERTRAWAGDEGAIYLNIAGREPAGVVPPAEVEQVAASLAERLRGLTLPDGARPLEVQRPAPAYGAARGIPPDLHVICTKAGWRPTAVLGRGAIWVGTRAAAMDAAYESPVGFMVLYDPHNFGGGRQLDEARIYDVTPTLLDLFGQPIPASLRGQVLPGF